MKNTSKNYLTLDGMIKITDRGEVYTSEYLRCAGVTIYKQDDRVTVGDHTHNASDFKIDWKGKRIESKIADWFVVWYD